MCQRARARPIILGISASLRNARWGRGGLTLVDELAALVNKDDLLNFISREAEYHLQNFIEAGRRDKLPFDQIYQNLLKNKKNKGLSNSEVCLASALWECIRVGCDIDYLSLNTYFSATGECRNLEELKSRVLAADGLIISTPVYFGDRSSLIQSMLDKFRNDAEFMAKVSGKIYGGISVGAKRNGGQETTLIYLMMDMMKMGFLAVGNDSDTTSQYGGTGHAGDVGTMPKDSYGLDTSMGLGRRVAHVASLVKAGNASKLKEKVRVQFWVLQDKENYLLKYIKEFIAHAGFPIEAKIIDLTHKTIHRCIACDICPTHLDVDRHYRCIIKSSTNDSLGELHGDLLECDAIIPAVYSPASWQKLKSNYQEFIERTRYLRRGDYVFSDNMIAPLVMEDVGASQNMAIRMVTSMIRHHTILSYPWVLYRHGNQILNEDAFKNSFGRFIPKLQNLVSGQLQTVLDGNMRGVSRYRPVGYILSQEKDKEDEKLLHRARLVEEREKIKLSDAHKRLSPAPVQIAAESDGQNDDHCA